MKCGILTFHYAHNYGAVLQAYALKAWIQKQGVEVDVIDYRNKFVANNYKYDLRKTISLKDLKNIKLLKEKIIFNINIPEYLKSWHKQWEGFEEFIKFTIRPVKICKDDLCNRYDVLIVGSDQIWTSWLTGGLDHMYFLDFPTVALKVSYAASVFEGYIKPQEIEYFNKTLNNFHAVSVREQELCQSLQRQCHIDCCSVCDPIFLLSKEEILALKSDKQLVTEKYILTYFVSEDLRFQKEVRKYARKEGLRLIEIHYYQKERSMDYLADVSPSEFVWLVENASLILTNSFHGIALSIILEKQFFGVYTCDSRKNNVLENLFLTDRHIKLIDEIDRKKMTDYSMIREQLMKYRTKSEEYLYRVLCTDMKGNR